MQIQETTANNSSFLEEPKTKDFKSALPRDNTAEPAKKKDKQKWFKHQQDHIKEAKETLAIGNNTVNATKKKKMCDISKVTCFNCNKKGHYAKNCTKLKN